MSHRRHKKKDAMWAQYSPQRRNAMKIKNKCNCKPKRRRGQIREVTNGDS